MFERNFTNISVCSGRLVSSPNYPDAYDNEFDNAYELNVEAGSVVSKFSDFTLEECSTCSCDYVKVKQ